MAFYQYYGTIYRKECDIQQTKYVAIYIAEYISRTYGYIRLCRHSKLDRHVVIEQLGDIPCTLSRNRLYGYLHDRAGTLASN